MISRHAMLRRHADDGVFDQDESVQYLHDLKPRVILAAIGLHVKTQI
jgi:hypothetical protein